MEALNQLTSDLIRRRKMDDILQVFLAWIGALLDAPDASFDLIENDEVLVTYKVIPDQPLEKGEARRDRESDGLSWRAIDSGEPVVLENHSSGPQRRTLNENHRIYASMAIPVYSHERVIGTINISRTEADKPFNQTDIHAAKQFAQMLALVLDNAQLYSRLQARLAESLEQEIALRETQAKLMDQQRTMAKMDERQRMARDLHDSVNQSIHSLILFSETLMSMLDKNNLLRARQISERLHESARQALKETRLLLYQTQASSEERDVNLIEELNARLANVELRAGVRAQIIQEGSLEYCPTGWDKTLFWIAIEALNNSLKHAQARAVNITLRYFPGCVEVEIVDNGRGFDATKSSPGGYGLRNMQERAHLLGGTLTVTSAPTKGTSILFHAETKE